MSEIKFEIEASFANDLKVYLQNEGIRAETEFELSEQEIIRFALIAIDWGQRIVFVLSLLKWLAEKRNQEEHPKFKLHYDGEIITEFDALREHLKRKGILK
ncbi:MAG: hypothetical protein HY394_05635 [Candidatus Diapherotrites archaeon]|nr:hypothetical protein [Candidatus Diapherotrites archaeon]